MSPQVLDAGEASHSPSAAFMTLVDVDHLSDFDQVVEFLKENLYKIIQEVHGFDKLLIDNGKTQLNCPPPPDSHDSHGGLLLKTLSEKEGANGITLRREFKVHKVGEPDSIEIREDIVGPETKENRVVVNIPSS